MMSPLEKPSISFRVLALAVWKSPSLSMLKELSRMIATDAGEESPRPGRLIPLRTGLARERAKKQMARVLMMSRRSCLTLHHLALVFSTDLRKVREEKGIF